MLADHHTTATWVRPWSYALSIWSLYILSVTIWASSMSPLIALWDYLWIRKDLRDMSQTWANGTRICGHGWIGLKIPFLCGTGIILWLYHSNQHLKNSKSSRRPQTYSEVKKSLVSTSLNEKKIHTTAYWRTTVTCVWPVLLSAQFFLSLSISGMSDIGDDQKFESRCQWYTED